MQHEPYPGTGVTLQALNMVTQAEMDALRGSLQRGEVPTDLKAKLRRLRPDDLRESYLRQQVLLLEWLLTSPAAQGFCRVGLRERERLTRMLAYVRKDDDAVPDTWPGGLVDDHDLMRMICMEHRGLLERFKAWRLAHQVPVLWLGELSQSAAIGLCN